MSPWKLLSQYSDGEPLGRLKSEQGPKTGYQSFSQAKTKDTLLLTIEKNSLYYIYKSS